MSQPHKHHRDGERDRNRDRDRDRDRERDREFDYEKFLRKWKDRLEAERFPDCERLCLKGLRMKPAKQDRSKLYNHLGYLYENFLDDKTFDDILEQYVLSLQVNHNNPSAHYNLAMFLLDQSITHLERAVEIKPNHKKAKKKLAALKSQNLNKNTLSNLMGGSQSALLPIKTVLQLGDESYRIEEQTPDGYRCVPLRIKSRGTRNIPTIYDEKRGAPLVDIRHDLRPSSSSSRDLSPGGRGKGSSSRLASSKSDRNLRRGDSYASDRGGRGEHVPRINVPPELEEEKDYEDEPEYSYGNVGGMRGKERPNRHRDINTPRRGRPDDPDTDAEYSASKSRSRAASTTGQRRNGRDASRLPPIPDNVPIRKSWPQCLCFWIVLGVIGLIIMVTGLRSAECESIKREQKTASEKISSTSLNLMFVTDCSTNGQNRRASMKNAMLTMLNTLNSSTQFTPKFRMSCGSLPINNTPLNQNFGTAIDNFFTSSFISSRPNTTQLASGIAGCRTYFAQQTENKIPNICVTLNADRPTDVVEQILEVRQLTSNSLLNTVFLQIAVVDNSTLSKSKAEELYTILGSIGSAAVQPPSIQPSFTSPDSCTNDATPFCSNCAVDADSTTNVTSLCQYTNLQKSVALKNSLKAEEPVKLCSNTDEYLYLLFLVMPLLCYGTWLSCTMSRALIQAATQPQQRLHSQSRPSKQNNDRDETATTIDTTLGKDTVMSDIEDGPIPRPPPRTTEKEQYLGTNKLGLGKGPPDIGDDNLSVIDDDVSYSGELVRIEFPNEREGGEGGRGGLEVIPDSQSVSGSPRNQGKMQAYV